MEESLDRIVAVALGDHVAKVLSLLDRGRAMAARGQRAGAEAAFAEAAARARRAATAKRSEWGRERLPVSDMVAALREAGLHDVAEEVEGRATAAIANQADHVRADNIVQAGIVHGGIHIDGGQVGRDGKFLKLSVTTVQFESTTFEYEGLHVNPDEEIRVFVEAYTAQAVLLHRMRPVFIRELGVRGAQARLIGPREFEAHLTAPAWPPAHRYDADMPGEVLTSAERGVDFPFSVTASDPEYFVIRPNLHGMRGPVEWRLELDWSCLGQHGTEVIAHAYRPFVSGG